MPSITLAFCCLWTSLRRYEKKIQNKKYNAYIPSPLSLFGSLRFVPITSSFSFLASASSSSSPSVSHLRSRYYSFSLSTDFTISFPLSRSFSYLSLYLAHSPYSRFHRIALLLTPVCSPQPYLVTHKRPACNSSGVRISQRTACFCHVRVTTASCTRACKPLHDRARMHSRIPGPVCCAHRPGMNFGREYIAHLLSAYLSAYDRRFGTLWTTWIVSW